MSKDIKAPTFPESVADGTIATWYKQVGDKVERDELLVDIETDKVVIDVPAPFDGVLEKITEDVGATIASNAVIGVLATDGSASNNSTNDNLDNEPAKKQDVIDVVIDASSGDVEPMVSPAAKKLLLENNVDALLVESSGKNGRVTKEDVLRHLKNPPASKSLMQDYVGNTLESTSESRVEKRVPMTRLRAKVAERLLEAAHSTAMLTTFNEVNMQPIMDLRHKYKDMFEKKHDGTRLGFMSFFVRASIEALKRFPAVNASIDDKDVIYHGYQDIGVAVSSPRGLVVPILRDADDMSLADIESKIREYGGKAKDGKLSIEEMIGGTFTISNGGVFGSLLSTPILNPPQTAILGMHKIQERPMAVNGEVKILPMMYLALSYDHRMIDGKEAVQFLVTIKELLEDPMRILLDV